MGLAVLQAVLGELAIQGDKEAINDYWSLCQAGRYGWIDNSKPAYNTLGARLETLPFWTEECATNCCRMNTAQNTLSEILGTSFDAAPDFQVHTYCLVKEWWGYHGGRLRWSELMGGVYSTWGIVGCGGWSDRRNLQGNRARNWRMAQVWQ